MAESIAQQVRRSLVTVVASYDSGVVSRHALLDSKLFTEFLDKPIESGTLDSLDFLDITTHIEGTFGIVIPDKEYFSTWKVFFERVIELTKVPA